MPDAPQRRLVPLCPAAEIVEGSARGFDLDDEGQDSIFAVRVRGAIRVWRDACPHIDGAPMAWRKDGYFNAAGTLIVCHAHGAEFLPDTGRCVQGPCVGKQLTPVLSEINARGELCAIVEQP
jgi:nitrite reductase/ring-hydroxylating ferredoxin subunit